MLAPRTGPDIIKEMASDEFYNRVLGGVAQTRAFSAMISSSLDRVRPEYKKELRMKFEKIGIPADQLTTDQELEEIAREIYHRANLLK